MRIALEIQRTLDLEARRVRRKIFLSRLWVRVRFRRSQGWCEPQLALVDTGAPYSLLPASLWTMLNVNPITEMSLRGIVPGHAAELDTRLASVSAQLLDATHRSPQLSLWALLTDTDQVPLVLGWAGCLDRATLMVKSQRNQAWLEF